jgi:hypothetical protein
MGTYQIYWEQQTALFRAVEKDERYESGGGGTDVHRGSLCVAGNNAVPNAAKRGVRGAMG